MRSIKNTRAISADEPDRLLFPFFYGWVIVIFALILNMVAKGMGGSVGVYLPRIAQAQGWSIADLSLVATAYNAAYGISMFLSGKLFERLGARRLITISCCLAALGLVIASYSESVLSLIGGWFVSGFGTGAMFIIAMTLTRQWFIKRYGLATGLVAGASGLGFFVIPALTTYLLTIGSWVFAMRMSAILTLVIPLTCAMFMFTPAQKGMKPLGYGEVVAGAKSSTSEMIDFSLGEALRTPTFWLLTLGAYAASLFGAYGLGTHAVNFAVQRGLAFETAGYCWSMFGITFVGGSILGGYASDFFGARLGNELRGRQLVIFWGGLVPGIVALVLRAFLYSSGVFLIGVVFYGLFYGALITAVLAGYGTCFGQKYYGVVTGLGGLLSWILGGASGPYIIGALRVSSGNYDGAMVATSISFFLAAMVSFLLRKPGKAESLKKNHEP